MTWEIHLGTRLHVKVDPSPPNIFNSQCISAEWPVSFEKNDFEILRLVYTLLSSYSFQRYCSLIGYAPVYHAKDQGSWLTRATVFYLFI